MSDDVKLSTGAYAPIQDCVCECGHWYADHGALGLYAGRGQACRESRCGCRGFVADPLGSTPDEVARRALDDPSDWPDHVAAGVAMQEVHDRLVGEGCPFAGVDLDRGEILLEFADRTVVLTAAAFPRRDDWPVHQPVAPEAPIPGRHWYSGCDPDLPLVNPRTGICEGCGQAACPRCGHGIWSDGVCGCPR